MTPPVNPPVQTPRTGTTTGPTTNLEVTVNDTYWIEKLANFDNINPSEYQTIKNCFTKSHATYKAPTSQKGIGAMANIKRKINSLE